MHPKPQKPHSYKVIIPTNIKPHPDKYEELVARILAQKFHSDVIFIERSTIHTPDLQVITTKQFWEIKNIRGNSKKTIEDNLRKASKQADRVVISLLRTQMSPQEAASRINFFLKNAHANLKQVILITKTGKCIDYFV